MKTALATAYSTLSIASLLQLVHLSKLAIVNEGRLHSVSATRRMAVFSPFNLLLAFMLVSNLCLFTSHSFAGFGLADYVVSDIVANIAAVTTQHGYVACSFSRSKDVIALVTPRFLPTMTLLVRFGPILFYTFSLADILSNSGVLSLSLSNDVEFIIASFMGATILAFDVLCISVFLRYIRSVNEKVGILDPKLSIITRYMMASSFVGIIALAIYVAGNVVDASLYPIFLICVHICFCIIPSIMLAMKMSLLREKDARKVTSVRLQHSGQFVDPQKDGSTLFAT
ncbi:hypothetical protein BC830DRAFT_1150138 [Chytriomyces sp. MP71]|nr:hypothetical protein BC830DRAFT_1150138 [Chytriomyces sp. MP71]